MGEWHQPPLLHPPPSSSSSFFSSSPLPSPLSSAALLRERQDGWLSSRPGASRSLIKGIVSPRMPCSVWQKGTRSPECYGLKRARVVWSAALHLRRAPPRFNPVIIALFLKREYATETRKRHRPRQRAAAVTGACASPRHPPSPRYLKFSCGLSHRGSCLATHVPLIASEHFRISPKNNTLCAEPPAL